MEDKIINTDYGTHLSGTPLTTEVTMEETPGLLRNTIDEKIVRIRPMSTPIEQLSRCAGSRKCESMTVEYYTVDTKPTEACISESQAASRGTVKASGITTYTIKTDSDMIFDISETILVQGVKGEANHPDMEAEELVLYVTGKPESGVLEVMPVNPPLLKDAKGGYLGLPALEEGTRLIRMGRAAAELDVQTAQFAALPKVEYNNCQIFKMQVEQSTLQSMSDKSASWEFTDQEEVAIMDMRLGMEKNYLFGHRQKLYDPYKNQHVYLTGGIWEQARRQTEVKVDNLTENELIDLCSKVFTQNAGSKRKIFIAGTGMIEALSKMAMTKMVAANEPFVKWGLEFKEIRSNFGSLYVVHSEIFDQCGHYNDGFVLDPEYLTKYSCLPFKAETLDLRSSGVRNTDAVVITEASCLVLRYPESHMRVYGKLSALSGSTEDEVRPTAAE